MSSVKVTIIGAGSVVFSLGLVKDLCLTTGLSGSTVHFMDINEERLDIVYRLGQRYAEELGADLRFKRTTDRAEARQDADFVIDTATITHDEHYMKRRRELAEQHGYFYGRTGMPEWHNLRLMLDVAQDMEDICPDGVDPAGRESGVRGHDADDPRDLDQGVRAVPRPLRLSPHRESVGSGPDSHHMAGAGPQPQHLAHPLLLRGQERLSAHRRVDRRQGRGVLGGMLGERAGLLRADVARGDPPI